MSVDPAEHAGLIYHTLKKYFPRDRWRWDDLSGVASLALLDAAAKFDAENGSKFSTFAVAKIRWAVLEQMRRGPARWEKFVELRGDARPGPMDRRREHGRPSDYGRQAVAVCPAPSALDVLVKREDSERLSRYMKTLTEQAATMVQQYYRDDLSQREIAALHGVTASRVCQVLRIALERLRQCYEQEAA